MVERLLYKCTIIILFLLKNVGNARLGEPYQSEDPNPITPTQRMKEEKEKTAEDK